MSRNSKPEKQNVELPELTEKQYAFVRALLQGKSASDAYREAYDVNSQDPSTVWAAASRIKTNSKVAAWLAHAKKEAAAALGYDAKAHMAELDEAIQVCKESGNHGAMVNAIVNKGKAAGVYIDRIEDITEKDDPRELLNTLARQDRKFAELVAKDLGVDLEPETTHKAPEGVQ